MAVPTLLEVLVTSLDVVVEGDPPTREGVEPKELELVAEVVHGVVDGGPGDTPAVFSHESLYRLRVLGVPLDVVGLVDNDPPPPDLVDRSAILRRAKRVCEGVSSGSYLFLVCTLVVN